VTVRWGTTAFSWYFSNATPTVISAC